MPLPPRGTLAERTERWRREAEQTESMPTLTGLRNGPDRFNQPAATAGYWLDVEQCEMVARALTDHVRDHLKHASQALDHHAFYETANALAAFDLLYRIRETVKADRLVSGDRRIAHYVNPEQLEMIAALAGAGATPATTPPADLYILYIVARFVDGQLAEGHVCEGGAVAMAEYNRQCGMLAQIPRTHRVVVWHITNDHRLIEWHSYERDSEHQHERLSAPGWLRTRDVTESEAVAEADTVAVDDQDEAP